MFKKVLASVLAGAIVFGGAAVLPEGAVSLGSDILASAVTYGDYEYTVLDDGTVEITKYTGSDTELTIPSVIDGKKVTSIGGKAFYKCTGIVSIAIPSGVTDIGSFAFYSCSNLSSITIPDSVANISEWAFCDCKKLTEIDIPNGITDIKYCSFMNCEKLAVLTIPNSVRSIGNSAFKNCKSLTSINIPNSVTSIGDEVFKGCKALESITIPSNVTSIGSNPFENTLWIKKQKENSDFVVVNNILIDGQTRETDVVIPDGVKSIGINAFSSCSSIKSVSISDSVTNIDKYAFSSCKNLVNISIPESVTSIGGSAFAYCTGLETITIPKSVISIGDKAFFNCTVLKGIVIPNGVKRIGKRAFSSCSELASVSIPDSVTSIGGDAFFKTPWIDKQKEKSPLVIINNIVIDGHDCEGDVVIPDGVKCISDNAFESCLYKNSNKLKSISIPDSVTSIGDEVFNWCLELKSITIPKNVESIGEHAYGYFWSDSDDEYIKMLSVRIICYKNTAGHQYAIDNGFNYELLSEPAPIHTHSYTSKITTAATCTKDGIKTYTCECGDSYTEVIKATGHKYTDKVIKPTYDAQGYTLHTCSCGDSYKDTYTAKLTRTSIAKAAVSGLSNKTYTGKAIKQTPVVKLSGKTLKAGTDYTVTYKNNKAVGTATVTITGKGAYTGTVSKTFKILPKKTTLKTAKSPKTKQLKVTYSKVAGVTGYQVTYSTSAKFTKAATKSVNVKGTSKTISKLTKGKTYYVKVRSYKTVGKTKYYSGYSAVKKVKVK